jgi:hypothetical protein
MFDFFRLTACVSEAAHAAPETISRMPQQSSRATSYKRDIDGFIDAFIYARWATDWARIGTPGRIRTCDQWVRNAHTVRDESALFMPIC